MLPSYPPSHVRCEASEVQLFFHVSELERDLVPQPGCEVRSTGYATTLYLLHTPHSSNTPLSPLTVALYLLPHPCPMSF